MRRLSLPGAGRPVGNHAYVRDPRRQAAHAFGLTETLGVFRKVGQAKAFVATVRKKLRGCEDKDLSTKVVEAHSQTDKSGELTIWHLTTEITDEKSVQFQMAILRRGRVVVQVGFVPDDKHSIGDGAFHRLAVRGLERVTNLPQK